MRLVLVASLALALPAVAQTSSDWQPFVLSTDAQMLKQGHVAAETRGGYDSTPQTRVHNRDGGLPRARLDRSGPLKGPGRRHAT